MGGGRKRKALSCSPQIALEKLSDLLNPTVGSGVNTEWVFRMLLMLGCLFSCLPSQDFDNESQGQGWKGRGRVCRVRGQPLSCLPVLCLRHRQRVWMRGSLEVSRGQAK